MNIGSSKLLDEAVDQMASLPGIGRKTALRLVLHLLRQPQASVTDFSESFMRLRSEIKYCTSCFNISDSELCGVCSNRQRDKGIVCVVEDIRDLLSIERTQQYKGLYHVLGGVISPMDGIGPNDLNIDALINRVSNENVKEIILALSTTMEGDTTNFFISKKLQHSNVKLSVVARGIGIGEELEYTDEITLGRSILNRIPYQNGISHSH